MTLNWVEFWNHKAGSPTDFQATGRGNMDVIGFLYTVKEVVRILNPRPDSRILDIGCGTGLLCLALAPWVQHVHGIDVSTEMIERAKRNLSDVFNASLSVGSIGGTGQPLGSFDRVLAYSVLQYLSGEEETLTAFREVHRVLGSHGRALLAANPDPARRSTLEQTIRTRNDNEAAERELKLVDRTLWVAPDRLVELAAMAGFTARAEFISPRIWQHFYMFDLVLEKHG